MINPITRLWRNIGFSWLGYKAAWQTEWAFRAELVVGVPLLVLAVFLPITLPAKLMLMSSVVFVVFAELANTAIEAVVNRISEERHPLSGKAKDIGSGMVMLAVMNALVVWCSILYSCFAH